MKKIFIVGLVAVFTITSIFIFREPILAGSVELVVRSLSGAPVSVGDVSLDIRNRTLYIDKFRMYNPKGFPEGILMDIPEMSVEYDRASFWKARLHIQKIDAYLQELVVIKNPDGKLNVDALKFVEQQHDREDIPVDVFELSINRVVYKDYTAGSVPSVKVFDLDIKDKTYRDLPGVETVIIVMLQEAMTNTAIKGAAIYGVITVAGMSFWPVGAAVVVASLAGKDSASADFNTSPEDLYRTGIKTIDKIGSIDGTDQEKGEIKANVQGYDVAVKIKKTDEETTKMTVSARKLLTPQPDFAKSVLYQISENLGPK
jgi:hypothetical protein